MGVRVPALFTLTCGFPTQVGEWVFSPRSYFRARDGDSQVCGRGQAPVWCEAGKSSLEEGCGRVATRWGAGMCNCVPTAACVKWGKMKGWWKLSLVGSPSSSQDGELQNQQSRFSRCPRAQQQASSRGGQALWAVPACLVSTRTSPAYSDDWGSRARGLERDQKGTQAPEQRFSCLQEILSRNSLLQHVNSDSMRGNRCQPRLQTETNSKASRWACVGVDGAPAGIWMVLQLACWTVRRGHLPNQRGGEVQSQSNGVVPRWRVHWRKVTAAGQTSKRVSVRLPLPCPDTIWHPPFSTTSNRRLMGLLQDGITPPPPWTRRAIHRNEKG